jgi:hypothetical protein
MCLRHILAAMQDILRKHALFLCALALTGCQTKPPLEQMSYSELGQLAGQIQQTCIAQGNTLDTPEYKVCTLQEISREQYTRQTGSDRPL